MPTQKEDTREVSSKPADHALYTATSRLCPLPDQSHNCSPAVQGQEACQAHLPPFGQLLVREGGEDQVHQAIVDQDACRDGVEDPLRAQGSLAGAIVVLAQGDADGGPNGRDDHKDGSQQEVPQWGVPCFDKEDAQGQALIPLMEGERDHEGNNAALAAGNAQSDPDKDACRHGQGERASAHQLTTAGQSHEWGKTAGPEKDNCNVIVVLVHSHGCESQRLADSMSSASL